MSVTGELALTTAAAAVQAAGVPTTTDAEADTPAIETPAYQRSLMRWRKCRDLMIGTEAIRAGGTLYLPQHPQESNARYEKRRVIAAVFNGFKRTVLASVGVLTAEEPTLGKDMPQQLVEMWENVDMAGTHGAVFTSQLALAGMVDGLAGIITEYPRANDPRIDRSKASLAATIALETGDPLSEADEKALGLRPYFLLIKADQVLLQLYETVNGRRTLVLLILREHATVRKGKFGIQSVVRYRVYQLIAGKVMYERWTDKDGKPERDEGPTLMRNLNGIPWSPFITGTEISPGEYVPPLMDLADLNITHHNINTGILSLEDLAFVPTPVRIGAPATKGPDGTLSYPPLVLGPSNTIEVPATQGVSTPVYWLSPAIDVLDPGMRSLEKTEAHMGAMGATFLTPQKTQETATAKRMDGRAEQATISTVSRAAKDCLESAFGFAGQYIKQKAGSVTLADDFLGEGLDTAFVQAALNAYIEDAITLEEFRHVLHTGQLPETFEASNKKVILQLMAAQAARQKQKELQAQTDVDLDDDDTRE